MTRPTCSACGLQWHPEAFAQTGPPVCWNCALGQAAERLGPLGREWYAQHEHEAAGDDWGAQRLRLLRQAAEIEEAER